MPPDLDERNSDMARKRRSDGTRAPNGASSIYFSDYDQKWHGRVTVGVRDDGKPDRRHVKRKTEAEVIDAVRRLERERDDGSVRRAGRSWTVEQWLTHWVENIAGNGVRPTTLDGYRFAVYKHLIPGVGGHRLDKLRPEHLEKLYTRMISSGSAAGTAHQAHRTIRTALNEAVRRDHLRRNPATIAKAPRLDDIEVEPFTLEEVRLIFKAAEKSRYRARWAVALALGLRQGEALGLKWTDISFEEGRLAIRRGLQRPRYAHGCAGTCGRRAAGHCPQRINTRPVTADTKSRAGRRVIGIPEPVADLLREHRDRQQGERVQAGTLWDEGGWVFTDERGCPINTRTDLKRWKDLLDAAGVREMRLHDARHTAATVLLILGVPERAVMDVMGWSNTSMASRYQHVTAVVTTDIAARVGALLWTSTETQTETSAEVEDRPAKA
jgi:integrase